MEALSDGEAEDFKTAQVIIIPSYSRFIASATKTTTTGGNDGTVTAEPTYDRVESSHVKDDTRAARCKSWLIQSGLQMILYHLYLLLHSC